MLGHPARVIHQEKMAAFGLLAAGIARGWHTAGGPEPRCSRFSSGVALTPHRRETRSAGRQLQRIERTIRELIDFSRPASTLVSRVRISEVVDQAARNRQVL